MRRKSFKVPDDLIKVTFLKGCEGFARCAAMVRLDSRGDGVTAWSQQQKNSENDGEENQRFELSDQVPGILTTDV